MALFYSKGRIAFISDVKTGTSQSGFTWRNLDVTLEVPGFQGSVTKQVFRASGDKVDMVLQHKVGESVQIGFSLYAREWNNRLYNNVELVTITDESGAVKAEPKQTTAQESAQAAPTEDDGPDLPF